MRAGRLIFRDRSHSRTVFSVLFLLCLLGCGSAVKKRTQIEVPEGYQQVREATLEELIQIINEYYARPRNISVKDMEVVFQGRFDRRGLLRALSPSQGLLDYTAA